MDKGAIRDRIKELRRVPARELLPNPKNWRQHGQWQQTALRALLTEVGYADALLARELPDGRLMLIDGHLRVGTTPDAVVPVLVLDVTEAEADKLLLTLDPLAGMAETDGEQLKTLLESIKSENESGAISELLQRIAGVELGEAPEAVRQNIAELEQIKAQRRKGDRAVIHKIDTERYLVLVFPTPAACEQVVVSLGLPSDERYIAAQDVELRRKLGHADHAAALPRASAAKYAGTG